MRGHPTTWPQSGGKVEPETKLNVPQQEGHPDTTEGGDIADYDMDIYYEVSEPDNEQAAQKQREVDPNEEYAKMEMPKSGTLPQRMMPWDMYMGFCGYISCKDLRLGPCGSRICTSSFDLAQPSCLSESKN